MQRAKPLEVLVERYLPHETEGWQLQQALAALAVVVVEPAMVGVDVGFLLERPTDAQPLEPSRLVGQRRAHLLEGQLLWEHWFGLLL